MKGYAGTYPKYTITYICRFVYMKYSLQNSLLVDYSTIVETIRRTEQTRNFDDAILAFKEIWDDFDVEPDFSAFSLNQQAELFRLSGSFLSNYGRARNLANYQERGKNHLTKAVELYGSFGEFEKVADAHNALALCYFFEGAILEAEAILEQTAADFLNNNLNLVYLQNRGNLLITKIAQKKYDEVYRIIQEIIVPMEFCEDKRTCSVFHEKVGLLFKNTGKYEQSIYHYNKAIEFAEEADNHLHQVVNKNNLANLYLVRGDFDMAHLVESEAIEIAKTHNLRGLLPHFLDTKAMIYFDEGYAELALETIEQSISLFQKGDDAHGLTAAIWNKCKFLLQTDRKEEAIKLFAELVPIASNRMGEFAVNNFAKEFSNLIHVKQNISLDEEIRHFKRIEIVSAIRNASYNLILAANALKINHSDLVSILDQEFPELYEELNIEYFAKFNNTKDEINYLVPRKISKLNLQNSNFFFENEIANNISTFYISSEKMSEVFDFAQDVVIAIIPSKEVIADEYILVHNQDKDIYSFGKVNYDSILDLYFLIDKDEPMPLSLDEVDLIGKATAYFPFTEIDNERIDLKPLKF